MPRSASISSTTTIGILGAAPGRRDHRPVEPCGAARKARRVDEDDLRCRRLAMPRIRARVVCTLWVTIDTFAPTSRFSSVDLPALGAPIRATKPERV